MPWNHINALRSNLISKANEKIIVRDKKGTDKSLSHELMKCDFKEKIFTYYKGHLIQI